MGVLEDNRHFIAAISQQQLDVKMLAKTVITKDNSKAQNIIRLRFDQ